MHPHITRRRGALDRIRLAADNVPAALRCAAARRARMARIVRELETHSDRDLADLGIARCDIRRIARESVERRPARP